jgi:hypothetical protein
VVSAEGINSQDGTAESLQYIPVLFEVVCAEGINSAGDTLLMTVGPTGIAVRLLAGLAHDGRYLDHSSYLHPVLVVSLFPL